MSEYNFKGIKPESIELLCLNRFNDSKEFYEEHKLELKEGITVPMRQIVLDLSGLMYEIDDKMFTDQYAAYQEYTEIQEVTEAKSNIAKICG